MASPEYGAQVLVDREGAVLFWSEGSARLFGFSASEVTGRPVDFIIPPKYRGRHWRGFRAAMERTGAERPQSAGNIPVLHADGTVKVHPFRQILLCDAFGRSSGAWVAFSDALPNASEKDLPPIFKDAFD